MVLKELHIKDREIYICCDSQAVLKALHSYRVTSKQIWECIEVLNDLTNQNSVTLTWVPVHAGIQGNERADQLAKQASHELYIGQKADISRHLPVSHMAVKSAIRAWTYKKAPARWQSNNDCRQAIK